MNLKDKLVLIVGYGKSGQSSKDFLLKKGAKIFVYDKNNKIKDNLSDAIFIENVTEEFIQKIDLVVLSPGVSIYSEKIKLAKLFGVKVIGELELGLTFAKGYKILVTGTNGKTTTVNLIEQAFNYAKKRNFLVGNVGSPITSYISRFKTNYIVETSSFQLESSKVYPNIACILNLSPNHLDRHFSYKEYIQTKYKIFENMTSKDYLILNADDEELIKLSTKQIKPKIVWFSQKKEVDGAFIKGESIYFKKGKKLTQICLLSDIKLFGKHNQQNVLAMIAICKSYGLKDKYIKNAIMSFRGVEHRLQLVLSKDGVDYINDSKSTTPNSTLTAVKAFDKPIILILGGSDKGINYDNFALKIKDIVKIALLTGEIALKLEKSFKKADSKNYIVKQDFYEAVKYAKSVATNGDVILLSPATASFDNFKNFEHRGKVFTQIIKSL